MTLLLFDIQLGLYNMVDEIEALPLPSWSDRTCTSL